MKRFNVYGCVTATKFIGTFEAESKEEAERMAFDHERASVCVCHQCANEVEDPEIHTMVVEEDRP